MTTAVGIDLGTSTSAVAVMKNGKAMIISTSEGKYVPSVVAFKQGERVVGRAAKSQAALNPEGTFFAIKRFLGRRYAEIQEGVAWRRAAHLIAESENGSEAVEIVLPHAQRPYSPQEIAALILGRLKQEAEAYLGETVTQAVITAPSHFNDAQRQSVREAGRLAGLEVIRILNETTAAALAYGLHRKEAETVLVIDLGAGTYDVAVLEISDGLVAVKASRSDTQLGGQDWDAIIAEWILDAFLHRHGVDLRKDRRALQRVWDAAERAKIELETAEESDIELPFIVTNHSSPLHLQLKLTRTRLQKLAAPLAERLRQPILQVLADAALSPAELDNVVLVGGASRMPCVGDVVTELTGLLPSDAIDPEEGVVLGAAVQAGMLAGELEDVRLRDVTSLSLGIETMGGLMTTLIPRNTPIPARRTEVFSTIEDDQTSVEIHILQGERYLAADNSRLGVVHLSDVPPAPRGVAQIEVTFAIDADGILHVSARDMGTGRRQALSIETDGDLSAGEVQRLVEEAEQHATDDQHRRDLIEARNLAQQIIYQTKRSLQHLDTHNLRPACVEKTEEIAKKIHALEEAVRDNDVTRIRRVTASLQATNLVLSQLAYDHRANGSSSDARRAAGAGSEPRDDNDRLYDVIAELL
jgi:molecular chaperone DnaK